MDSEIAYRPLFVEIIPESHCLRAMVETADVHPVIDPFIRDLNFRPKDNLSALLELVDMPIRIFKILVGCKMNTVEKVCVAGCRISGQPEKKEKNDYCAEP